MNIFSVHNGILTHTKKEVVNTGSRNFFKVQFVFDDTWKDFTNLKFVEFYQNENCPHFKVQLDNQNIATIPTDILNYDLPIFVGVSAEDIGGSTLANTNFLAISTENGSNPNKENVFTPENSNITNIYNTDKTIKYLRVQNGVLQYSVDNKLWKDISGGEGGGSSGEESLTALLVQKEVDQKVSYFTFEIPEKNSNVSVYFYYIENATYIDWGDKTIEEYTGVSGNKTHTYAKGGKYVVKVYDATVFFNENISTIPTVTSGREYLTEIVYGDYVKKFSFNNLQYLKRLVLPKLVEDLSKTEFYNLNLTQLVFPKNINVYANPLILNSINNLHTIVFESETLPQAVKFSNLTNLKKIFVPNGKVDEFKALVGETLADKVDSIAYLSDLLNVVEELKEQIGDVNTVLENILGV